MEGNKTKDVALLTMGVTFALFMTEAIIHYNIGVKSKTDEKGFNFPPTKDFIKLATTVGLFSVLNGIMVKEFTK